MPINAFCSPVPKWQVFDDAGTPLAGAKLYTYAAGTTTLLATYTSATSGTPAVNPIVFDSAGRSSVFLGTNAYKLILCDPTTTDPPAGFLPASGSIIWTVDNVIVSGGGGSSANIALVNSMAELIALTSGVYNYAIMTGYYQKNDEGGGQFYWDAAATTAMDYGMVIVPTDSPTAGRWLRLIEESGSISVRWYGAKGDGTTDNATAFGLANAYAYATLRSIFIPKGNFKITTDPAMTVPVIFSPNAIIKWTTAIDPAIMPVITDKTFHFFCPVANPPYFPCGTEARAEWFSNIAIGSGTADDTDAFTKALGAIGHYGGTLLVSDTSNFYSVASDDNTSPILSVPENVTIIGQGPNSIFKAADDGGSTGGILGTAIDDSYERIKIHFISIDGNAANNKTYGSAGIVGVFSNSEIKYNWITNCENDAISFGNAGASLTVCENLIVAENNLSANGSDGFSGGISIYQGKNVIIKDNIITETADIAAYGIAVLSETATTCDGKNIRIEENKLSGCGIYLFVDCDDMHVSSGMIINNEVDLYTHGGPSGTSCIYCKDVEDRWKISGNRLRPNTTGSGIKFDCDTTLGAAAHTCKYDVTGNYITMSDDTAGTSHNGITIKDAQYYDVYLGFNTIVSEQADGVLTSNIYGIAEIGSLWAGRTAGVYYSINNIVGFQYAMLNLFPRTIYTNADTDIQGNLTVDNDLYVMGTLHNAAVGCGKGYIDGFKFSVATGNTKSITVQPGQCSDSSGAVVITLGAAMTKQIVNTARTAFEPWVAGDGNGGTASTATIGNKWLHVFMIIKGSTVDIGVDTSLTATQLLADSTYTYYRRIGSIYMLGSSMSYYIKPFKQYGDDFEWYLADQALDTVPSSSGNITLSNIPTDVVTIAKIITRVYSPSGSGGLAIITTTDDTTQPATEFVAPLPHIGNTNVDTLTVEAMVNVLTTLFTGVPKVRINRTTNLGTVVASSIGWHDFRGKDGF